MRKYTFTSESVTEGHPDKMADQISDAILDAMLSDDPMSRVACETFLTTGLCLISGEITTDTWVDIPKLVRKTICDIGYDKDDLGFDGNVCGVLVSIGEQSPDIAQGIAHGKDGARGGDGDARKDAAAEDSELGAGDQGMMFGFATNENEEHMPGVYMPLPIQLAHRLAECLAEVRRSGVIPYLRPDGKVQVSVDYEDGVPKSVSKVLISTQHLPGISLDKSIKPDLLEYVIRPTLGERFAVTDDQVLVNPTGKFEIGGPVADAGLTGRKIIVDTYGGMARHGGGAFSGKDPTKVDRSAAYAARWAAKNLVACGAADRCELQLAYAIGKAEPFSVMIETFGTEKVDPTRIEQALLEVFDLRPAAIIEQLGLRQVKYQQTAAYGHFGRDIFPWEQLNRTKELRRALGL